MVNQVMVLDKSEVLQCVFSNKLKDACAIIELWQEKEMYDNGAYSDMCVLSVPANHADAINYLSVGAYILFRDGDGIWQEYRITNVIRTDGQGGSVLRAQCEHAFYELYGEPLDDIRPTTTTAALAITQALAGTRWELQTTDSFASQSCRIYKTNVLDALSTIAYTWGGELKFYVQVSASVITGRKVELVSRRGNITGKRFEYNKDIQSVVQTIDMQGVATALIGRGKGVEVEGGTESVDPAYGRRLEFTDTVWTIGGGDDADKPAGQNWIGDDTSKAAYGYGGRHIYDFVTFDNCTDAEELLQLTYDELQIRKSPKTTYEMSVIVLEEISGYEHEAVRLGDTVNVINSAVSPSITGSARVVRVSVDLCNPASASVVLGTFTPSVSSAQIAAERALTSMGDRTGSWDRAQAITSDTSGDGSIEYYIDLLQTRLSATTTAFETDENGNFIWSNVAQTAALKIGAGIFAIADTKTAGAWNWRTFGTGAGFTADEVNAGTLRAGIIFAGTLSAASGTFTSLLAGLVGAQRMEMGYDEAFNPFFKMYDNANVLKLTLNKNGIKLGTDVTARRYEIGNTIGWAVFTE